MAEDEKVLLEDLPSFSEGNGRPSSSPTPSILFIFTATLQFFLFSFPLLEWENVKAKRILNSLSSDPVDVTSLRHEAATKGGLLCNELRKKVWPKLLGINTYNIPPCELIM